MPKYSLIGVHDKEVPLLDEKGEQRYEETSAGLFDDVGKPLLDEQGFQKKQVTRRDLTELIKVARVRMFLDDGTAIDEDFPYPEALTPEQQLYTPVMARIEELKKDVKPEDSVVTEKTFEVDQVINEPITEAKS